MYSCCSFSDGYQGDLALPDPGGSVEEALDRGVGGREVPSLRSLCA